MSANSGSAGSGEGRTRNRSDFSLSIRYLGWKYPIANKMLLTEISISLLPDSMVTLRDNAKKGSWEDLIELLRICPNLLGTWPFVQRKRAELYMLKEKNQGRERERFEGYLRQISRIENGDQPHRGRKPNLPSVDILITEFIIAVSEIVKLREKYESAKDLDAPVVVRSNDLFKVLDLIKRRPSAYVSGIKCVKNETPSFPADEDTRPPEVLPGQEDRRQEQKVSDAERRFSNMIMGWDEYKIAVLHLSKVYSVEEATISKSLPLRTIRSELEKMGVRTVAALNDASARKLARKIAKGMEKTKSSTKTAP